MNGTSLSTGQRVFYDYEDTFYPAPKPIGDFWGWIATPGDKCAAVGNYKPKQVYLKAMKSNAQKIDDATEDLFTVSHSRQKAVLVILQKIPQTKLIGILKYRDIKDSYRYGAQHLDVLAITFSGSNNCGIPPLDFDLMPII